VKDWIVAEPLAEAERLVKREPKLFELPATSAPSVGASVSAAAQAL
jgi:hypothetical protein